MNDFGGKKMVTGKVESKEQKISSQGVSFRKLKINTVDGVHTYNDWKNLTEGVNTGDSIDFEFETRENSMNPNSPYRNLTKLEKLASGTISTSTGSFRTPDEISRTEALKLAVQISTSQDIEVNIRALTNQFYSYIKTGNFE